MSSPIRTIVVGVPVAEELEPVLPSVARLAQSTGADLFMLGSLLLTLGIGLYVAAVVRDLQRKEAL